MGYFKCFYILLFFPPCLSDVIDCQGIDCPVSNSHASDISLVISVMLVKVMLRIDVLVIETLVKVK